ncbi:hypothetical protein DO97_08955 [Neosynechococcus sphagnicola sy1]|uniref:SLH domain-containing protein n=1 Tax=Neosynechococcus sphagnicola sy1 TaxID=1497020 RepID=A0A098TIU3_9CYAN|nr:iron uptake porin [Neosynechococcus sphagnicola]KGF72475.1 hypothetical protein DO97_08955 [Neosynechococcus sphagnicola sy1]
MNKFWLRSLLFSPVLLGASLLGATSSMASEVQSPTVPSPEQPTAVTVAPAVVSSTAPVSDVPTIQPVRPRAGSMRQVIPVSQLAAPESPTLGAATPTKPGKPMGQVTSVSQLSDVQPTDWAFQALQSLVERYGCIAGYPDSTYRGQRALTRYEFAAGLNACMQRVEELLSATTSPLLTKEELLAFQKLQEEFAAELAMVRGQVDTLEARTTQLEAQQFSTTTKLNGEIVVVGAGLIGDNIAINSDTQRRVDAGKSTSGTGLPAGTTPNTDIPENTILADRIRLNFDTSFTGKDQLRTRFQANNITPFQGAITGTSETRLAFDGTNGNDVFVSKLQYRFPVGDKTTFYVAAVGGEFNDNMFTFNPLLESSARGALSRFGRFNPIYNLVSGGNGTGFTVNYKILSSLTITGGYFAGQGGSDPANPLNNNGLFNGAYSAIAQLQFKPTKTIDLGFTYVRAYSPFGAGFGGAPSTTFSNNPFASTSATGAAAGRVPTTADAFGWQGTFRVLPKFTVSAWAGYTQTYAQRTVNTIGGQGTAADPAVENGDQANIFNAAITFAFQDLLKDGDLAGLVVGLPPRTINSDFGPSGNPVLPNNRRIDQDTTVMAEGFYRFSVNDNLDITPGIIAVINPEGNASNDPIFVGVIRSTFRF